MIVITVDNSSGQSSVAFFDDVIIEVLDRFIEVEAGSKGREYLAFKDGTVMFTGCYSLCNMAPPFNALATNIRDYILCVVDGRTPSGYSPVCGNAVFVFEDRLMEEEIATRFAIRLHGAHWRLP